ncbi:site-specific integrase [Acidithiobacillus thiooxidans]|uniref:Shufflon-specific DNA recombinase n=1 Tax=Acidithiobacillus thiooxidans ATCC 19377 TaxID=637390 RepID=A0A543PZY2_ACITH|nr:site-specific integrase [Acidithiobacillus thiooxidans]MDX5936365.1 site-specific integrase [Acidithiobacillus thiooxidans]TQN49631.1 Shufflon-specific DNA recombinase [Acidithiobacillus thiooxidans ATCC 19377]
MAAIRPRKDRDGIVVGYQVQVQRKGYPAQTKTFRSKADAQAWATVIESEMQRGVWRDRSESENTTLTEALDRYAQEIMPCKKSPKPDLFKLHQWQSRPIAKMFLASIRGKDVAAAIRDMEAEGKAANTIRLYLALLSHLFTIARKEWGMEALSNPVELVRKPKLPQGRDRRLVDDEETRLLDTCQAMNPELASIVGIAIETAMRQGEIMGMTWNKVDLKRQTVTLEDTKNGEKRIVPLTPRATQILRDLPRNLDGKVWNYTPDGMRTSYNKACKRAGIEGLTFHDLRHEGTSRLFEKGLGLMQVAAITGHKNMQMLKRYTHLKPEDLVKLLNGG